MAKDDYPALRTLLTDTRRLYPEERRELITALGRVTRLAVAEAMAAVRIPACVCDPAKGVTCVLHAEDLRARMGVGK